MNPDKLFDYLDGKLSPNERAELEERFMSDPEARRELSIARKIHANMGGSREIVGVADATSTPERGPVLARRIMIAFMLLVIANVCFGIYAVFFMKNKQRDRVRTEQNRTELTQSLSTAAAAALPTPTLGIEEITLSAPAIEQIALSDKVIATATQSGGSAAKGLTYENGILIFVEIPTKRLAEFRDGLKKLGATIPAAGSEPGSGEKTILQVRIAAGQ
ncbi:MAG: zf-HC2 domain-containing protein [Verrucomicrobia bacterium]|nr:zf-HC2 domain-containing protein [Verrucomicrobiota bacterium]